MLRSTLITIMALGAAFLSFGCGGGDESEKPSVFHGYDFPDPIKTNFDTESGKGYLSMEITLQVSSPQDITNLGAKSQLLKHAVTTFLAKKETQEILPDLVTDPDKMGEYIQEAIKEELDFEPQKVVFRSFIRQ